MPIGLPSSTTGRWRKPFSCISVIAWPKVLLGLIVFGSGVITCASGVAAGSSPRAMTRNTASRSLKMPTRRSFSTTSTAPTPSLAIISDAARTVVVGGTVRNLRRSMMLLIG